MQKARSESEIGDCCAQYLASALEVPAGSIDRGADLLRLGVDSATLVTFMAMLEDFIDADIDADVIFYHKTIDALARHLASRRGPTAG